MTSSSHILAAVAEQKLRFIALWFTDITGLVKSVMIPARELENVFTNGSHFDGSAIEGFARVAESDMVLMPDPGSFAILPWTEGEEKTARLICAIHTQNGEPFIGDPRNVLKRALQQARELNLRFKTGMELEFFLFPLDSNGQPQVNAQSDIAGYFDIPDEPIRSLRRHMLMTLAALGIRVDSTHSETGSGQHEIDFQYDDALRSADNILTARIALKSVASQFNYYCTFMPRPHANRPGSGMHTHQSLHAADSGANLFADSRREYSLSEIATWFLAGQLEHARAMCAVLAPLVNSYKRLGTSFEAPIHVTWAHVNRNALIRVPSTAPGKEYHARLELRCPDPTANPYLAMAVMLQAGLDGIRHKMPLPEPMEETLMQGAPGRMRQIAVLPQSLDESLDALSQDDVILSALGPYVSDRYIAAKRQECAEYNRQVTEWELSRYLSRY
ncbi:MAG: glutamine synthetase family protein [Chloroflexi bacterium]|nr:glutamine synthetase family protein [Chloroflexota bacterium]MDE2652028.1 glutamine synthetase family protein [Chloroflexota bacterium]MXV94125.1 glutamine synthetase [Chloroflexota bacterium]MXX50294.1 glutamine synthetase [Chloroflexota bacterium]MYA91833.1 glutamine synthetase [Chloroflexota bacterium]